MFIDASAIVAILAREKAAAELIACIERSGGPCHVSPLVRYEAVVSLARARAGRNAPRPDASMIAEARKLVDSFLDEIGVTDLAISGEIGNLAIAAAMTWGKAVGHPADLNFGDCFAYACAKASRLTLLYTGEDFAKTDQARAC